MSSDHQYEGLVVHMTPGIEGRLKWLQETKDALAKLRRKHKRTKVADREPIQKQIEEFEGFVAHHEMHLLLAGGTLPKE